MLFSFWYGWTLYFCTYIPNVKFQCGDIGSIMLRLVTLPCSLIGMVCTILSCPLDILTCCQFCKSEKDLIDKANKLGEMSKSDKITDDERLKLIQKQNEVLLEIDNRKNDCCIEMSDIGYSLRNA